MKTRKYIILGLIGLILMLTTSCSIQKRRYRKGFYVSWNKNYSSNIKNENTTLKVVKIKPKKGLKTITIKKDTTQQTKIEKEISDKTKNNKKNSRGLKKESSKPLNKTIIETPIQFEVNQTEITTDTIQTVTNNEEPKQEKIKNEKLSTATFLTIISVWLFIFGGFIGIIIAYFLAVTALKQIRENPEIYKEKEKRKALIIIIGFNIFFFTLLIISSIILISESLIFYLVIVAFIYSILGLIGLLMLRQDKKR